MIVILWSITFVFMIINIIIFGIRSFFGGIAALSNKDYGTPYRKAQNRKKYRSLLFAITAFIVWSKISIYALEL